MARILIVDDEETYLTQLTLILESWGQEVRTTGRAKDALREGEAFKPHLLIADWQLSDEMTGPDIASRLRARMPDLALIVMTGYAADDLRDKAIAGVDQILEKPFGIDDLRIAVERALPPPPAS